MASKSGTKGEVPVSGGKTGAVHRHAECEIIICSTISPAMRRADCVCALVRGVDRLAARLEFGPRVGAAQQWVVVMVTSCLYMPTRFPEPFALMVLLTAALQVVVFQRAWLRRRGKTGAHATRGRTLTQQ